MADYVLRRLLLLVPTLIGILLLNFLIVQAAPGGPVDQMLARLSSMGQSQGGIGAATDGISVESGPRRGGTDPAFIDQLNHQFGFDRPLWERFVVMVGDYAKFDFGDSFFRGTAVSQLILERLPVTLSLGLWTVLLMYLVSIPLGIAKAVRHGSRFDGWTSGVIIVGYAIPGFLFASLLITLFAGGHYFDWFPLRGLVSSDFSTLSPLGKVADYFHHIALPVIANTIGSFATLTLLVKNGFLDEIHRQYVLTARAKGASERRVLYGHVFRNAMLVVISGLPGMLVGILITGALLIEYMFSLEGIGLLGFEALLSRDYPVIFGTLYVFTLLNLLVKLISDLLYMWIDPRINFEARG